MKAKILFIILAVTIILTACTQSTTSNNQQTINLTYTPVTAKQLKEGQPKENWIKEKSIYFEKLNNQIDCTVHLYQEKNTGIVEQGVNCVYAFLEHEGKFYEIGSVSNYSIEDVSINLIDRTFDGVKEIEIIGNMGTSYSEMKVIGYNQETWTALLVMGSPLFADLNDDGIEELTAVSTGSLPSFVNIYRWQDDKFEKVSITEITNNDYANLYNKEGNWIIESGKFENDKLQKFYYKYDNDKLIEINNKNI